VLVVPPEPSTRTDDLVRWITALTDHLDRHGVLPSGSAPPAVVLAVAPSPLGVLRAARLARRNRCALVVVAVAATLAGPDTGPGSGPGAGPGTGAAPGRAWHRLRSTAVRRALAGADRVVVLGETLLPIAGRIGVPADRVALLDGGPYRRRPHGGDLRRALGWPAAAFVVAAVDPDDADGGPGGGGLEAAARAVTLAGQQVRGLHLAGLADVRGSELQLAALAAADVVLISADPGGPADRPVGESPELTRLLTGCPADRPVLAAVPADGPVATALRAADLDPVLVTPGRVELIAQQLTALAGRAALAGALRRADDISADHHHDPAAMRQLEDLCAAAIRRQAGEGAQGQGGPTRSSDRPPT
jgi:hypothetical protein